MISENLFLTIVISLGGTSILVVGGYFAVTKLAPMIGEAVETIKAASIKTLIDEIKKKLPSFEGISADEKKWISESKTLAEAITACKAADNVVQNINRASAPAGSAGMQGSNVDPAKKTCNEAKLTVLWTTAQAGLKTIELLKQIPDVIKKFAPGTDPGANPVRS